MATELIGGIHACFLKQAGAEEVVEKVEFVRHFIGIKHIIGVEGVHIVKAILNAEPRVIIPEICECQFASITANELDLRD